MGKIRSGDNVVVLIGRDRGRRGKVTKVLQSGRVIVEGVNLYKRHSKPNPMKGHAGGIIEQEVSVELSNVALVNPATQKADRVGFKVLDDGRKVRVFKSNGEIVDA